MKIPMTTAILLRKMLNDDDGDDGDDNGDDGDGDDCEGKVHC